MGNESRAPSAFRIEQAMAAGMAVRQAIMQDDPDLAADETALREHLDETTDVYEVMRRMARFALDSEALADAAKARAEKLLQRKARFERRAEQARGAVFGMLDALGERRYSDAEFTLSVSAGTPGVVIYDEAALPDSYVKTTRAPMKAEIGKALKAGETIDGASLQNGMPRLTIRSS